jgi:CRISPR-associated protein Csx17
MGSIALAGCTPEPLMSYLKALGVFRLVAEQSDPHARLSWSCGVACLTSTIGRSGLEEFFLDDYQPTPITAPWNGGSGFYGGGAEPLDAIARSTAERLALYRETIRRIRAFTPKNKPKDEMKESLLLRCRSELGDEIVPWLDVCFSLGERGPSYFPLLGTGGNDGRLDFTNNFMQRLAEVIAFDAGSSAEASSKRCLAAALFADTLSRLGRSAIGQFNPGGVGGANATQGRFEADSRVNPWDFVLMIEGALLFAGSVARRLGANVSGRAAFPFSVASVAVGYGSATASEETIDGSRAELWLPLWRTPAGLGEVRHLFAEGRAQLGRRQARNSVEFALAVNLLGVNRGIASFTRYGFLRRNGLAFLAAPLGRIEVTLRPRARLLDDPALAKWLDRLRTVCRDKDKTPARYQTCLRRIDRAMFEFAQRGDQGTEPKALIEVLRALGRAERTLADGIAFCKEKGLRPLHGLSPQWLVQADDNSREFRLAASLAGIKRHGRVGPLRVFLEQVEVAKHVNWSQTSTSVAWSRQPLVDNLSAVFRRRLLESFRDIETWRQSGLALHSPRPSRLEDVAAFLNDQIDSATLDDLLWGLSAVDWPAVEFQLPDADGAGLPFEFGVPRLLVQPRVITASRDRWEVSVGEEPHAKPDVDVFQILAAAQLAAVDQCVDRAAKRLKSCGRPVHGFRNRQLGGPPLVFETPVSARRLLAAMLFPLTDRELETIANAVLFPPESEE